MEYVVVGGLSLDHIRSAAGERMLDQFGGNAAYGAAGARIWAPGRVGMVARQGDGFPDAWLAAAAAAGVDTSGVTRVHAPHGLVGGMVYDARGDRDNYVSRADVAVTAGRGDKSNAGPLELHRAQVAFGADASDVPAAYLDAAAVHLAPRYLKKQLSCAELYRRAGGKPLITLDPIDFYMHLEREDDLRRLFGLADALLPSELEVNALFGPVDPVEGAKLLAGFGAPTVVVKIGGQGCIVHDGGSGRTTRVPIYPATLRDPTGAGDSFCGGFLVGLRETGDPVSAAMYGTVSASFVVEGFGAEHTYRITRDMAEERLRRLRERVD